MRKIISLLAITLLNCAPSEAMDTPFPGSETSSTKLHMSATNAVDLSPGSGIGANNDTLKQAVHLFPTMQSLNVEYTGISDLDPLVGLPNLTDLNLGLIQIKDQKVLSKLTTLTRLNLAVTNFNDPTLLRNLTKLLNLDVGSTQISDLRPLSTLTNLTVLDLSFMENPIDLTPVAHFTKLTQLNLNETPIENPKSLASLANLKHLRIRSETFTNLNPVTLLPKLVILEVFASQVRPTLVWAKLTQLTQLDLNHVNNHNQEAISSIQSFLPNLRIYHVVNHTPRDAYILKNSKWVGENS